MLLAIAKRENAILLTCDSDFLDLRWGWKIIYLRHTGDPDEMANLIERYIFDAIQALLEKEERMILINKQGMRCINKK